MAARDDFLAALERADLDAILALAVVLFPHIPAPKNRAQAEVTMHLARTEAASLPLKARAYSHRWLVERMWPSYLPDDLKPAAERMYPRVAATVGIGVHYSPRFAPLAVQVRQSMEGAVLEAEADGKLEDAAHVRVRMAEAKDRTIKALLH